MAWSDFSENGMSFLSNNNICKMSDYDYEDEQEYNENEYARYGYDGEY